MSVSSSAPLNGYEDGSVVCVSPDEPFDTFGPGGGSEAGPGIAGASPSVAPRDAPAGGGLLGLLVVLGLVARRGRAV